MRKSKTVYLAEVAQNIFRVNGVDTTSDWAIADWYDTPQEASRKAYEFHNNTEEKGVPVDPYVRVRILVAQCELLP